MIGGRKRSLTLALKVAVSLGLMGWLVASMLERESIDALGERLGDLSARWLLVAVAIHFVAVAAGVARWRILLGAQGIRVTVAWALRAFLVGRFIGAFTPSTTGLDGWRIYETTRHTGLAARGAAAVLVEKLVALVAMALVCVALVPFGAQRLVGPVAIPLALGLAAAAGLGLWVLAAPGGASRVATFAPRAIRPRLTRILDALSTGRLGAGVLARSIGLGLVSHLALAAVFVATSRALGIGVGTGELLVVGTAIILATLLPISIGGVGVREGVAVALLASVPVPAAGAALIALLGYLTGQVPALAGGLLLLLPADGSARPPAAALAPADGAS